MAKHSTGSGPRHHYFNIVFSGIGKQQAVISRVIQFPHARVSHAQLEAIRQSEGIDSNAPLLGVHYLGRMTEEQWRNELWDTRPEAERGNGYGGCLLLVAGAVLSMASAAGAVWWWLQ